ncbi:MAG: hypothetical protein ACTHLE_03505 [Agriterribacter sp.]
MRIIFFLVVILTMYIFPSCEKDDQEQPAPDETNDTPNYGALVRSIEWDNGTKAEMIYNTDSTLKQIDYSFQNIVSATVFEWEAKKVKVMYDDRSLYKNTYYYTGDRIAHYINSPKQIVSQSSYKMEYTYKSNGQLDKLKYFTTNEAGTELKTSSIYEHNAAGDLTKVTTTNNNSIITHTIESYSDSADFNPLIFIEVGLFENYTIYNLPVMSRMKKYPTRIVRTVKTGDDEPYIDKITENTCEISDRRINKLTSKITVPGMPQYSNTVAGVFKYE